MTFEVRPQTCQTSSLGRPHIYMYHAGHTRKASRISKAAVDNCGKGVGNFYLP